LAEFLLVYFPPELEDVLIQILELVGLGFLADLAGLFHGLLLDLRRRLPGRPGNLQDEFRHGVEPFEYGIGNLRIVERRRGGLHPFQGRFH